MIFAIILIICQSEHINHTLATARKRMVIGEMLASLMKALARRFHFTLFKEIAMPKTLIILVHLNLAQSTVNKHWAAALRRHADRFTVHELYAAYPQGKIDVTAEQKLVENHDALVWQFPVYWFN